MDEAELVTLIDRESASSMGVNDTMAADRETALSFYYGKAEGDLAPPDVDGRSRVVSKVLMDTVEWAMPCLMRMFAADDAIRFEADDPSEDGAVEQASAYVGHLFYRLNEGFTVLHDAIKSALIQKLGWIKVYCDETYEQQAEHYAGLSEAEVQALQADPDLTVTSIEQDGQLAMPAMMQGMPPEMAVTYAVTAERKTRKRVIKVEAIPPEEIRVSREERTIIRPRYIAHERDMTASDLLSMGIPQDAIDEAYQAVDNATERLDRASFNETANYGEDEGDASQKMHRITEAYLSVDFDGDGIAEYRKVVKVGRYIHENVEVDDHNLAVLRPIRMPHQLAGLSFYDVTEDLMRIKTALTRQMLDNAYLANSPQTDVVEGQVNFDDLLNPRIGGIRRVKSLESIRTSTVPFIGPQALALLEHFGQEQNTRTGVTEMNAALNSEALAKSNIGSEGIQQLTASGQQRMELIARSLADDLKRVWHLLLKHAIQYTDRSLQMKINGKWLQLDPSSWRHDYRMTVSVGVGHAGKAEKIQGYQIIGQAQQQLHELGAVTTQNAVNTASDLIRTLGFDPDRYVTVPQGEPQKGPPEAVQVEQVRQQGAMQLAQVKAQTDAHAREVDAQAQVQVEQAKQAAQAQQAQHLNELEAERERLKLQNEMALEQFKVEKQMELEVAKAHIQQQTAIEVARINAEAKIASAKTMGAKDNSTADADVQYQETHEQ
jgi:hypothetical protein